jgi:hypothetical protein
MFSYVFFALKQRRHAGTFSIPPIPLYPIQLGESYRPCKDLTAQDILNNAIAADKDIININKK